MFVIKYIEKNSIKILTDTPDNERLRSIIPKARGIGITYLFMLFL